MGASAGPDRPFEAVEYPVSGLRPSGSRGLWTLNGAGLGGLTGSICPGSVM